jgi:5-methylthioadenosine/S-adenosylhomocysteine deaminase
VSDETLIRVRRAADELELPMTMHVNETRKDVAGGREPALARLERLGVLSPLLTAVHVIHADPTDIERLARGGASVAHCPQSNLKLGNGVCPVPLLRARGVNVALGTDGAASNNDLNMLDEMRSAALLARGMFPGAAPISAHDWLRAATLDGAHALGLGESIGSIAPGKWADLCCTDLRRAHTQPVYDPAAQILFAASRDQVSDVWVAGRALVREGQLIHMDLEDLLNRAARWRDRIQPGLPGTGEAT